LANANLSFATAGFPPRVRLHIFASAPWLMSSQSSSGSVEQDSSADLFIFCDAAKLHSLDKNTVQEKMALITKFCVLFLLLFEPVIMGYATHILGFKNKNIAGMKLGVLYIKTYKTASSTMSGVLYRYAHENNLTVWKGIFMHCNPTSIQPFQVVAGHNYCGSRGCSAEQKSKGVCRGLGYQLWLEQKMIDPFVRVVLVAEPRSRLVSSYFYRKQQAHISSEGNIYNVSSAFQEKDLISYALNEFNQDRDAVQWHWLADSTLNGTLGEVISLVLPTFIVGLTDRFEETLLVLREVLGVSSRSILYANLKTSAGTHSNSNSKTDQFFRPSYDQLSQETRDFISSVTRQSGDSLFYSHALKQFEAQWSDLNNGLKMMSKELEQYQSLQSELTSQCSDALSAISSSAVSLKKTLNNPRFVLKDSRIKCMLDGYDERESRLPL
jgi:hypothetical protein